MKLGPLSIIAIMASCLFLATTVNADALEQLEIEELETALAETEELLLETQGESLVYDDDENAQEKGKITVADAMKHHIILDQYIVVFDETKVSDSFTTARDLIMKHSDKETTKIMWNYTAAFQGVALSGVTDDLLDAFDADPKVIYYEPASSVIQKIIVCDCWNNCTNTSDAVRSTFYFAPGCHGDFGLQHPLRSIRSPQLGIGPHRRVHA